MPCGANEWVNQSMQVPVLRGAGRLKNNGQKETKQAYHWNPMADNSLWVGDNDWNIPARAPVASLCESRDAERSHEMTAVTQIVNCPR